MVAKSFQNYAVLGDPYTKSGKMYVDVENPKTKTVRSVRWYSETEYQKLYPDAIVVNETEINHRKILGFGEQGFITIFSGINDINEDWFIRLPQARYHNWWGWYIVSDDVVPTTLPEGIETKTLYWDSVKKSNLEMKSKNEVIKIVEGLIYANTSGRFIGSIGDKINIYVNVTRLTRSNTQYGSKDTYLMIDQEGNEYVWKTDAGKLETGEWYNLRAKVKEHKVEKGHNINYIWYCVVED